MRTLTGVILPDHHEAIRGGGGLLRRARVRLDSLQSDVALLDPDGRRIGRCVYLEQRTLGGIAGVFDVDDSFAFIRAFGGTSDLPHFLRPRLKLTPRARATRIDASAEQLLEYLDAKLDAVAMTLEPAPWFV